MPELSLAPSVHWICLLSGQMVDNHNIDKCHSMDLGFEPNRLYEQRREVNICLDSDALE